MVNILLRLTFYIHEVLLGVLNIKCTGSYPLKEFPFQNVTGTLKSWLYPSLKSNFTEFPVLLLTFSYRSM